MSLSRRRFLQGTSASLMAAALPASRLVSFSDVAGRSQDLRFDDVHHGDDPELYTLLARALEAARDAGATYADVRYEVELVEGLRWGAGGYPGQNTELAISVGLRALYQGYWGYAARSGVTTADDLAQLGREATAQAKTGAKGRPRTVELAPRPVVSQGRWVTPGAIDPFTIEWGEKADVMNSLDRYVTSIPAEVGTLNGGVEFRKRVQTFSASDGACYTQTLYSTGVQYGCQRGPHWRTNLSSLRPSDDIVSRASAGWEYVATLPGLFERESERLSRQTDALRHRQKIDVGRYDIVFDGAALAGLVQETIGNATLLDRAMGYRANAVGTSYLNDPMTMLGTFKVGSPLLTVTADRSMPGGAATVKWDDEGVEPDEAMLVTDGVLTDFQTTRESASWLTPYYQKLGRPVRSHGGAGGRVGSRPPEQQPHNLIMKPSAQQTSFEDLCKGVKKGLAILGSMGNNADQQALNVESTTAYSGTLIYEITNGKMGRVLGAVFGRGEPVLLLRAPDFWKNLVEVGGPQTVQRIGVPVMPTGECTVSTPAALVTNVAVTNETAVWR